MELKLCVRIFIVRDRNFMENHHIFRRDFGIRIPVQRLGSVLTLALGCKSNLAVLCLLSVSFVMMFVPENKKRCYVCYQQLARN